MTLYDKVANLRAEIESYELQPLKQTIPGGYTRYTTVIKFRGQGVEGVGEDVTYGDKEQLDFQKNGPALKFDEHYSIDEFSKNLNEKELFVNDLKPTQEAFYKYRRWAFESAFLDLALKQSKTNLADILNIGSQPVNFVASVRLDKKTGLKPLKLRLDTNPSLRFKLDPLPEWTNKFIAEIAALKAVDVLDLKGHYKGTPVDVVTDPSLYKKLLQIFPNAIIEDPDVNKDTFDILKPQMFRLSWDAPIHNIDDTKKMPFKVRWLNIKPSRFGSIKALFDTYDYCRTHDIKMYGGGQFELGPGRRQIQYLASLFHPKTSNDVAPKEYNLSSIPDSLPKAPLLVKEF